jgi:serine/threonine-protein kinase
MDRAGPGTSPHSRVSFGKYELLASLGQGGMADVYLAAAGSAIGVKKLVVLKRPRDGIDDEDLMRAMFLDEARLAARLNHPNVVQTHEVGQEGDIYFIAMEYLDGQSIDSVMRHHGAPTLFTPRMWATIAAEALSGLHYAHELTDYDGAPLGR